jgi:putative phosphoserine phosphatase/1-acylglycerol-3-phosphate O-acyltransferase
MSAVKKTRKRGPAAFFDFDGTLTQVEPFARRFDIAHVLCTRLELKDGICTGRIAGRVVFGPGNVAAVTAFAAQHPTDLDASFAYGNGDEDIPFLSAVGNPGAVNPQPELERMARSEGWPIHRFTLEDHRGPLTRVAGIARLARNIGAAAATAPGPN